MTSVWLYVNWPDFIEKKDVLVVQPSIITNICSMAHALTSAFNFSIEQGVLNNIEMNVDKSEALLYLASFCKNCGEHSTSVEYCNRLLDLGGQESVSAKALLREIRSLENTNAS